MSEAIQRTFPGCPAAEARAIASHTAQRGSGRVGRTATGRNLDEQALALAVAAGVRHRHTDYDSLLASRLDRGSPGIVCAIEWTSLSIPSNQRTIGSAPKESPAR